MPTVEKVFENLPAGARLPLSKLPPSAVTVCVIASLLVQVTVVPITTERFPGEKLIPAMVTAFGEGGGVVLPLPEL